MVPNSCGKLWSAFSWWYLLLYIFPPIQLLFASIVFTSPCLCAVNALNCQFGIWVWDPKTEFGISNEKAWSKGGSSDPMFVAKCPMFCHKIVFCANSCAYLFGTWLTIVPNHDLLLVPNHANIGWDCMCCRFFHVGNEVGEGRHSLACSYFIHAPWTLDAFYALEQANYI